MNLHSIFQKLHETSISEGPWKAVRENGFRVFESRGLPTKKDEDWKYTSLRQLTEATLVPARPPLEIATEALREELSAYLHPDFWHIVMVDGALSPELSNLPQLSKIHVYSLNLVEKTSVLPAIQTARKKVPELRQDSMEALNSAFFQVGLAIEVPADTSLGRPLQVLHYSSSQGASYPKILVRVGPRASLALIETYISVGEHSLTDSVLEAVVEKSAKLEYVRVQAECSSKTHVGCSRIFLDEMSALESLSYSAGGQLARHNLDLYCLGEHASAQVNGLTVGTGSQHHDNHTRIEHIVGQCSTTQLYKSILDDESRAVFNGVVFIHPQAQKASSEQLNNNLLLSSKAEADSKPQLDVYADDVKATHGSTVGQLNPEELFYIQSRGIPREKAFEMLSLGFVQDLIDRVSTESVRHWLSGLLQKSYRQLKGGPS